MSTNQIFSQNKPAAGVDTVLYSSTGNVIANMWIASSDRDDSVSIALVPNGTVLSNQCYISYNTFLVQHYEFYLQNICIGAGDNVVIRTSQGSSSFTFTGRLID